MAHAADAATTESPTGVATSRLAVGYAILAAAFTVAAIFSITAGRDEDAPPAVAGIYSVSGSACLGTSPRLEQSGQFVDLSGGGADAKLRLRDGRLRGTASARRSAKRFPRRARPRSPPRSARARRRSGG